jgi:hypothetical protein
MRGRIPVRFAPYLFGGFLSAIMVSVVSAVVLLVNRGLTAEFPALWLKAVLTAWPVAFPTVLFVAPAVRRWVNYLTSS